MNPKINDILEATDELGDTMTIKITNVKDKNIYAKCIKFVYADGTIDNREGKPGEWDLTKMNWRKV